MTTRAKSGADGYELSGAKAWITHGGDGRLLHHVRPDQRRRTTGITCFHVPGDAPG